MNTPTTAEEILSALSDAYFRCRSYRDVGVVTTRYFPDNRPERITQKPFWTVFGRPDRFRFEYRNCFIPVKAEWRSVVWAAGGETRSWWNVRQPLEPASNLREALRNFGGTSSRLSWIVPSLLPTGWANGKRWKLAELARLDDATIEGTDCYRVQGHFPTAPNHAEECEQAVRETLGEEMTWNPQVSPTTFWIEKGRLLLRRFEDSGRIANFRFEHVAEYQPEIDVPLTDAELAFGVG
jgi:hypothetical protein